jgi:hypothetical protein
VASGAFLPSPSAPIFGCATIRHRSGGIEVTDVVLTFSASLGSVLISVPFFREFGLKRLLHSIQQPAIIPGLENLESTSIMSLKREIERFKSGDGTYVMAGIVLIGVSYLLHMRPASHG